MEHLFEAMIIIGASDHFYYVRDKLQVKGGWISIQMKNSGQSCLLLYSH